MAVVQQKLEEASRARRSHFAPVLRAVMPHIARRDAGRPGFFVDEAGFLRFNSTGKADRWCSHLLTLPSPRTRRARRAPPHDRAQ